MDLKETNSRFACTPTELKKVADLTIIKTNVFLGQERRKAIDLAIITVKTNVFLEQKKAMGLVIIAKTWGDPGGKLVKPCYSLSPDLVGIETCAPVKHIVL